MRFRTVFGVILILLMVLPFLSAAHFIVGRANDALDGTDANGRTVVLWNPANGMNDNLTDVVGPTGNSGVNNTYFIDCELLSTACAVGDEMRVKVIDDGMGYTSYDVYANVTGSGFDVMPNITLNSPPNVTLVSPVHLGNVSGEVTFQCDVSELDNNGDNVTLYGNWSGGWHANETVPLLGVASSNYFTKPLADGTYEWSCLAFDNLSASDWSEANYTVTVDSTAPVISSVLANESYMCGTSDLLRVNCTVTDALSGIDTVLIGVSAPSGESNVTAQLLSGDTYYADILLDELGSWGFSCIANDTAGNTANASTENITAYDSLANLAVFSSGISFSNSNPVENENITIHSTIFNNGCGDSGSFLFGFYNGDPDALGVQIGNNQTLSIVARSNFTTNTTFLAPIGPNNIFVLADVGETVSESNESDNKANLTLSVPAWQDFYGVITSDKLLANNASSNVDFWANETISGGNIFISDVESQINWNALQAIGRNLTNVSTSDDFSEIDSLLNMSSFTDSVSNTFTTDGNTPQGTRNISVNGQVINFVPIVNSTSNSSFITGILWDTSDDANGEFSSGDSEDLVFITQINKTTPGFYGTYDYELRIPAKLREQDGADATQIYLYYELDSSS